MLRPNRQNIGDVTAQLRSSPYYVLFFVPFGVAVLGLIATTTHSPLVMPPIGATIYILFAFPLADEAKPRNVICAYIVGVICGAISLAIFGLVDVPASITDLGLDRVGAITLTVGLTVALLRALHLLHIPAIAGALLVALGLLSHPIDWLAVVVAATFVTASALAINRLFGIPMPLWSGTPPKLPAD